MSTSSVRAAVVAKEHRFVADVTGAVDQNVSTEIQNGSRSGSSTSDDKRNPSPLSHELSVAQEILSADLNPVHTSTPIVDDATGNGVLKRRTRSHSGNSVTFQGATPTRPGILPVSHSSGLMATPGINHTNPDEIIILEGDSPLTASTASSNSALIAPISRHNMRPSSDVQIQAPIVGYEIMEERARFTVFKIHVAKSEEDWFIFRRYTDFVRLNDKLKDIFPHFRLSLPPKKWFGDNFDRNFLEDRMLGLQAFLNNVTSHRDVAESEPVKEFFCYDDPPGAHDSLEESKALCETLEERIYDLKRALKEKDTRILLLEEEVSLHKAEVENLRKSLRLECTIYSNSVVYYQQLEPDHILSLVLLNLIERALNAKHKRSSPTSTSVTSIASQRSDSSLLQDQTSYTEADQAQMSSKTSTQAGEPAGDSIYSGCDSVITSPSTSSIDLLENLQDLRLHSIHKVENFNNDPNANCEIAPISDTADLIANINYTKQDSVSTLVSEDLDKSAELEWDEDVASDIGDSAQGFLKPNGAALLPAT